MFTKLTLWLAIIVSMIIGGAAGFEIDRQLQNSDTHHGHAQYVSYLTHELDLTTNQQKQLDSILNYVHPKFQAIRKEFNVDMQTEMDSTQNMINNILTSAEQQSKFRVLIAKIESNRNQQDSK
ncbi:MAG: hypothetical protein WAO19_09955 [Candidatus Kryptoniota bacterium]